MATADIAEDVTVPAKVYKEYLHYKELAKEQYKEGRKGDALFSFAKGNAPVVQSLVGGAGIAFVMSGSWFDNIQLFKDHAWLKPVLVIAFGYWLWNKGNPWARAVIAAGGFMLYQWYKNRPTDAKGPDEAGTVYDWSQGAPPASALPGGRVPMSAGDRIAERAFRTQAAA